MQKAEFPPIQEITKPCLTTKEAAFYLNRKEQTLREWACLGRGPIKPLRVSGRLMWQRTEIMDLLNQQSSQSTDMVEIVQELVNCLYVYGPDYMHGMPKFFYIRRAQAALAKATGSKP